MSTVEYDAKEFLQRITPKSPAPPPQAPSAKSEPVVPQKPVVLPIVKPVEDKEALYRRKMDDELGGTVELLMFPEFFSETGDDTTVENAVKVFQYVIDQGKHVSRASVSEAIKALKKELTLLRRPEPPKQPIQQPSQAVVLRQSQAVVPTPPDPEAGLPPLPDYVKRMLGDNPLRCRKEIYAVPNWLFSELYRGPFRDAFKARLDAVGRRK